MAGDFNDPRKDITLIPGLAERTDGARARSEVWFGVKWIILHLQNK